MSLVPWRPVARRVGLLAIAAGAVAILGLAVTWALTGDIGGGAIALWVGIGTLLLLVSALLVVTAGALRGMLRAGERDGRLAGDDVGLLPPQVRRRREEDGR